MQKRASQWPFALAIIGLSLLTFRPAQSQQPSQDSPFAQRPPLGWNSWDAYGLTIDEAQFRDNVAVMNRQLKPFGYRYALIDEGWFLADPNDLNTSHPVHYEVDDHGRYVPVPARFPSAMQDGTNTGFRTLSHDVHALGLKFGVHIVRGIPRVAVASNTPIANSRFHALDAADKNDACPWDPTNWGVSDTPAGQAWYDALLQQYAAWGVDYLKVDCVSDHPYKLGEIRMIHRAIEKTGRPILLSLSPGPTSEGRASELQQYAQMWRISDDIWDYWRAPKGAIYDQFVLAAGWVPFAKQGTWPDADMLPVGYLGPHPGDGEARPTRLTHDEQITMMTLWSLAKSPLIVGANLTQLDPWTLRLLTNADVLAVDQTAHDQMQASREHDMISWIAKGENGVVYLALFNVGDRERLLARPFTFYGIPPGPYTATELWTATKQDSMDALSIKLRPHACVLYRLSPAQKR